MNHSFAVVLVMDMSFTVKDGSGRPGTRDSQLGTEGQEDASLNAPLMLLCRKLRDPEFERWQRTQRVEIRLIIKSDGYRGI